MQRIKLVVQYDGSPFCGLQRQAEGPGRKPSVQGVLEHALGILFKLKSEDPVLRISAAGRTDAGVHARAMPMQFDCPFAIPAERLPVALNKFLPESVSVHSAEAVGFEFDVRHSARLRWYRYQVRLQSRREPLGPRAWQVWKPVDLAKVEAGLPLLLGRHDFAGFRSSNCQSARTVLVMRQASMRRAGDLLAFDFKCRSFLHHQVRFMVGSLMALGRGLLSMEGLLRIRDEFDRPQLAACAPAHGLCLMGVGYTPEECDAVLAEDPEPPNF
jgi:tRNA pseudouridine38-40 synthase